MEWTKKSYLKYRSNTPKYTTSDHDCMQNNQMFDITFCIYNNLKMIIKIFSTVYLSLAVLFTYIPSYWLHKNLFPPMIWKNRVSFQSLFLNNKYTFKGNILADWSGNSKFNPCRYYICSTKILNFETPYLC